MGARVLAALLVLGSSGISAGPLPPAPSAAEYYYRQHDYAQALPLWQAALKRDPTNVQALIRVAELSLWTEGRANLVDRFREVLDAKEPRISWENRTALIEKLRELQSVFLTDRAQGIYYQGKHRAERGDLRGALASLTQATDLERGQFLILRDRALLEKELRQFEAYYQTLRLAVKSFPYDAEVVTQLAAAHLHFRNPRAAIEVLQTFEGKPGTPQRTLLAVAWADAGEGEAALAVLRGLGVSADRKCASPVLCHAMGEALATLPGRETEARRWRERFLDALPAAGESAWDPFHLSERAQETRRRLGKEATPKGA